MSKTIFLLFSVTLAAFSISVNAQGKPDRTESNSNSTFLSNENTVAEVMTDYTGTQVFIDGDKVKEAGGTNESAHERTRGARIKEPRF